MIVAREKTPYYDLPELPVDEKKQRRRQAGRRPLRKEQLALTGLVVLFFCTSVLIAFYYAQVLVIGYKLNKAESELAQLRKESHDLYTRVNRLSSLENVEALAVNRLGMVAPCNDQVILVQSVAPPKENAEPAVAATEPENRAVAGKAAGSESEQNWVIRAFTKMVGRLEASINTG